MASLSTGFEGLNLGAGQTDRGKQKEKQTEDVRTEGDREREHESNVVTSCLGAIPKQSKKKKSERNRNRNKKTEKPQPRAINETLTVQSEAANPLAAGYLPEANPEPTKTPILEKRSRRGKRQLKTTNVENEDTDVCEKVLTTLKPLRNAPLMSLPT